MEADHFDFEGLAELLADRLFDDFGLIDFRAVGIGLLEQVDEAAALASQGGGIADGKPHAERLAVADLGTAVHLDVQLDLAQQFVVELQPLAGGISGGVVAQHAHCRAEVVRLQLRRHLAHRRGDHFAEHLQVPIGRASRPAAEWPPPRARSDRHRACPAA